MQKNFGVEKVEQRKLRICDEKNDAKQAILKRNHEETIQKLYDYIFGDGENPFQEITDKYQKDYEDLEKRIEKFAEKEKQSYVGRRKKGVNEIKKMKEEV